MQHADQLAPLKRMRRIATGLLGLMAVVFIVARLFEPAHPAVGFVRAFAESALVGALADWFAVTALFRHPLGLPIPHTAIIQKNKDRIGASVANFLEHNFMTRDVISSEFMRIDFAGAASRWLAQPANSQAVAAQIVDAIPSVLQLIDDAEVGRFIHGRIGSLLRQMRFAPLLAEMLSILVADQRHQELFDQLLSMVSGALEKNQAYIRQKIHDSFRCPCQSVGRPDPGLVSSATRWQVHGDFCRRHHPVNLCQFVTSQNSGFPHAVPVSYRHPFSFFG